MALGKHSDLLSDSLAIVGIKGTIELIHDVEWSSFDLLDGKDQASSHDSFLTSREMAQ